MASLKGRSICPPLMMSSGLSQFGLRDYKLLTESLYDKLCRAWQTWAFACRKGLMKTVSSCIMGSVGSGVFVA